MLNITEVRIKKIEKGNLLAAASLCINKCFIINEIKLIDGKKGRFISMPKRKIKNKNYTRDFAYPMNNETREKIFKAISKAYDEAKE